MVDFITLMLLLVDSATVSKPSPTDIDILTKVIVGEGCGYVSPKDLAAIAVVHTLLNHPERKEIGIEGVAEKYYHGYKPDLPAPWWAKRVAQAAYILYEAGIDTSGGCMFVLSRTDLEMNDRWYMRSRAIYSFELGEWGLYGFNFWPL